MFEGKNTFDSKILKMYYSIFSEIHLLKFSSCHFSSFSLLNKFSKGLVSPHYVPTTALDLGDMKVNTAESLFP